MLIFPLKKEWYEKIKSGEKAIEYREVKPYWEKRINKILFDLPCTCVLRLGYTKKSLIASIVDIQIADGLDTDLAIDKPVYAIHLAHVKQLTE